MKKALIVLLALLLVALMLLMAAVFGHSRQEPDEFPPVTATADISQTQAPEPSTASPEPSTEAPTESAVPEPQLFESGKVFIVNAVRMSTFVLEGDDTVLVEAEAYLSALGLTEDGCALASDKALVSLAPDGLSVNVGEKCYDTVLGGKLYVPVYEFAEDFGYPAWVDDTYGGIYITTGAKAFELEGNVDVPVLMYHAVSDDCWGYSELFVSPTSMEAQLKYLVENGYDPIWFEDLAHLEDYDKPVILTFDDGYDDNYTELFPLLKKYNVKATVFVIAKDTVGIAHKLTEEQIREMSDSGLVSIQSHGYSHGDLSAMSEEELEFDLLESKKILSRITGKTPYVLCYPTGKYSSITLKVAREHYNFGLKMVGGMYSTADDPYLVNRYYIARSTGISQFAVYLSNAGSSE